MTMTHILTNDAVLAALRTYGDVKPIPWDATDERRHEHRMLDALKAAIATMNTPAPAVPL
jgi:hypothetical protein